MHISCGKKTSLSSLLLTMLCACALALPVPVRAEEVAPAESEPTVAEEATSSEAAAAEEAAEAEDAEELPAEGETLEPAVEPALEAASAPDAPALTEEEQFLAAQAYSLVAIDEYQGVLVSAASVGRSTPPDSSNTWFYSDTNPYYQYRSWGLAPCGVAYGGAYTVGNCTWYAWGRAAEALGYSPDIDNGNPLWTWQYVSSNGIYPTGSTPRVGALVIGTTPYGSEHIAYVEEVRDGVGYVSESFYGTSGYWPGFANVNFRSGVPVSYAISDVVGYIYLPVYTGPVSRFPDVPQGHWATNVIEKAADLSLIVGYSNGDFGPEDHVTRAQAAVILWRMAGCPSPAQGAKSFADVQRGSYYYTAVRWASAVGVVSGYKTGGFGPNDGVTREQLAVMLANYSERVAHKSVEGSAEAYGSMSDASRVSAWASKAMGWCFANGILSGSGDKALPKNIATRAHTAKMFVTVYEKTR